MARRKTTVIDGNIMIHDPGDSILSVLERLGRVKLSHVVAGGEIISADDFDRPVPSHDMITNQTPMIKGGTLRDRLLDQEFVLIATRFLGEFPGRERSLDMDDKRLIISAFPLPDDYSPDHVDLLFVLCGYPEVPPPGVHIPAKSPNRQQIVDRLDGHVIANSTIVRDHTPASFRKYVDDLAREGWDWICYHHKDWVWQHPLNPNNLLEGDCLFKFVENTYAALAGGHRN